MPLFTVPSRHTTHRRPTAIVIAALTAWALLPTGAVRGGDPPSAEQPSTRQEIAQAMQELERKYGKDAVALEGQLLGQAVRSGSLLPAEISVPGIRDRDGKRFLVFDLDTGIVFNDRDSTAEQRATQMWANIVDPSLRRFATLTFQADGIALLVSYRHRDYADLTDLRAHLRDDPGATESAAFYVLLTEAAALAAGRLSSQQLVDRTVVLVDGAVRQLTVPEPTPVPTAANAP